MQQKEFRNPSGLPHVQRNEVLRTLVRRPAVLLAVGASLIAAFECVSRALAPRLPPAAGVRKFETVALGCADLEFANRDEVNVKGVAYVDLRRAPTHFDIEQAVRRGAICARAARVGIVRLVLVWATREGGVEEEEVCDEGK